ncbi:MAG: hypothetical protein O7E52_01935 [Candidatus Poribacteria bacterium]|nr:hypothetical protein [Candidatus Poribacteria bacterium]
MKKRSKIIAVIAICSIAMLMLLINQYKNLNAKSDGEDKSGGQLVYQAKRNEMPGRNRENRGNRNAGRDGALRGRNSEANRDKDSKADEDFYRVVIENNLFRNLGWKKPNRKPQYTLMATLIESKGNIAKAFVMEQRENQYYYVSVGEKVGDATVKKIRSNEVMLYQAGNMLTIRTESSQFLSGSDGEGGEPRPSNRENRPNRNSENRDGKQPNLKKMKNRFQNASPEEIQRMKEEFRRAQGNKKQVEGKAKKEDKSKDDVDDDKGGVEGKGKVDYREVEGKGRVEGRGK